jgi:hypothetical protein
MPKRSAAALLSPKTPKKSKTAGNQQTIRSFFAASSLQAKQDGSELETVVIDLSLDESDDGGQTSEAANTVEATVTPAPKPASKAAISGGYPAIASPLLSFPDLSIDPLEFALAPCPWDVSFPAPYAFLVHALVTLSSTRSRISITNTLVNTFRLLIRHDARRSLLPALYMLSNCLAPSYEGVELNVGPSVLMKAIQSVSGISAAALKTSFHKLGMHPLVLLALYQHSHANR